MASGYANVFLVSQLISRWGSEELLTPAQGLSATAQIPALSLSYLGENSRESLDEENLYLWSILAYEAPGSPWVSQTTFVPFPAPVTNSFHQRGLA